jgi:ligand-binding sensor domain-containing protein
VPGITASPSAITTGGTSTLSANLTYNSAGLNTATGGTVMNGTPVRFTATGGTVSPEYAVTNSGIATTTFTPSGPGTASITATVDDQSVTVPVTVTTPAAGTNVTSIVIDPATPANVYAGLDGSGIYRSSNAGGTWTNTGTQPTNMHIRALAINPAITSRLYAGTYGGGVFRSVNSGADWTACTAPANPYVLSLVRNASGSLYAGTDDGIFVSSDDCASWMAMDNGLP